MLYVDNLQIVKNEDINIDLYIIIQIDVYVLIHKNDNLFIKKLNQWLYIAGVIKTI